MKIKHFQGYGIVNAKKVSKKVKEGVATLIIEVWGNHEWGIERNDVYDVFNWLVKRFDKGCESYSKIISMTTNDFYKKTEVANHYGGKSEIDEEHCIYTIKYEV